MAPDGLACFALLVIQPILLPCGHCNPSLPGCEQSSGQQNWRNQPEQIPQQLTFPSNQAKSKHFQVVNTEWVCCTLISVQSSSSTHLPAVSYLLQAICDQVVFPLLRLHSNRQGGWMCELSLILKSTWANTEAQNVMFYIFTAKSRQATCSVQTAQLWEQ